MKSIEETETLTSKTYWVRIYISGPIDVIKQACRAECADEGLCVTVDGTTFIYTGGEEQGAVIGLINYPRFPKSDEAIMSRARGLAMRLLEATHQGSVLVQSPDRSEWITRRD